MKKRYDNPLVIAVTGGIGSGQSTVCSFFKEWNCKVINADKKAKDVIRRNLELQKELQKLFGKEIIENRRLNTKLLAERAFKDELSIQKLNQQVHPRMVASLVEEMENARFSKKYPILIIDAALIYEISIEQMFDAVIVVNAPLTFRSQRVCQRDNMTKKHFKERADKQIPLEEKVKWADYVIENTGSLEELKTEAQKIYKKLMNRLHSSERKKTN